MISPRGPLGLARFLLFFVAVWRGWVGSNGLHAQPAEWIEPFDSFALSEAEVERFWNSPEGRVFDRLTPQALADLVPTQGGFRGCACPACRAGERQEPLTWNPEIPDRLTCRSCGRVFPNDTVPAKVDGRVPEEVVQLPSVPGTFHRYPYHRWFDEATGQTIRLYFQALIDDSTSRYLTTAALHGAFRGVRRPEHPQASAGARKAAVLLARFAEVVPQYVPRLDLPDQPKLFGPTAGIGGFGRWRGRAWEEIPEELIFAYALLRHHPVWTDRSLFRVDPRPSILSWFQSCAEVAGAAIDAQPDHAETLRVVRGELGLARLLGSASREASAQARLVRFFEQGFSRDGLWREGTLLGQQRVLEACRGWLSQPDRGGWDWRALEIPNQARALSVAEWLSAAACWSWSPANANPDAIRPAGLEDRQFSSSFERMVHTDRRSLTLRDGRGLDRSINVRGPRVLGGSGWARLEAGDGSERLTLDLRGVAGGPTASTRLALRVFVGGEAVLGDLDDLPARGDGFERSVWSHTTVVIDRTPHGEIAARSAGPPQPSDLAFFAADPDFQVVGMTDRWAYRDREGVLTQVLLITRPVGGGPPYGLILAAALGGTTHHQLIQAAPGRRAAWRATPAPHEPINPRDPARALLKPNILFLEDQAAQTGRWFIQGAGHWSQPRRVAIASGTFQLVCPPDDMRGGLRWFGLNDGPIDLIAAHVPDGLDLARRRPAWAVARSRENSPSTPPNGSTKATDHSTPPFLSRFAAVVEPIPADSNFHRPGLRRAGRVEQPGWKTEDPRTPLVVVVETEAGEEHLILNATPFEPIEVVLADGSTVRTDGLAARVCPDELRLAGGTFLIWNRGRTRQVVELPHWEGRLTAIQRTTDSPRPLAGTGEGRFVIAETWPRPQQLSGRTLIVRDAVGHTQGWTIESARPLAEGGTEILTREPPDPRLADALLRGNAPTPRARVAALERVALPHP